MAIFKSNPQSWQRTAVVNVDTTQNNGFFIPRDAYYVVSGSFNVIGSQTGSVKLDFDSRGLRLIRFETFNSGAAGLFDVLLETSTPNTGSFFDPRDIVVRYDNVVGSVDFSSGVDQIEDIVCTTDAAGSLYLKIMADGVDGNTFKYHIFFESIYVYI